MTIRKCTVEEAAAVGDFYDATIKFMNDNNVNYPKWLYKIFPSKKYAVDAARAGTQFICADGEKICVTDLGRTFSGIPQFCCYERNLQ